MNQLPLFVSVFFIITLGLTLYFLYKAAYDSVYVLIIPLVIIVVQSTLAHNGFYSHQGQGIPRPLFIILPSLITMVICFIVPQSRHYLLTLNPGWLTFLHVIRFPIELVLFWLFLYNLVPEIMTFNGWNYDVVSGISAPIVAYYAYVKKSMPFKWTLIWNILCLLLLLNIVVIAILSAPTPFQQFAFDHPNTGIFYFPFVCLPAVIVPLVMLSHIVSIYRLLKD
ncbi:MAG TPA: hypothetical protein VGF79_12780 [Bacteroidia bacterium]